MSAQQMQLDRYLGQAFDSVPVAMIVVNAQGRIVRLNRLAEGTFGYAAGELLGQAVEVLIPQRLRHAHPGYRRGFLNETHARPMGEGRDLSGLRKDGTEFPVEIGINPVETGEGPMVLSVILDLSERKQAEQHIQAALQQKDLLLRDSQNRIRSMSLIHQTLYQSDDIARVDFERFLGSLLPQLMESYAVSTGKVKVEIQAANVKLPIHEAIPCDLIVNELVSNALKHGFDGTRQGSIEVLMAQQPGREIQLSVSNDGHPIPESLDIMRTGSLGLQLVNLLTQQLRGQLTVQRNNPTRFTICFRLGDNT
jgi:PAS domain S-box-containing protein